MRAASIKNERRGELHFLFVELADLSSIRPAVDEFRAKAPRLDVLFDNAAVSLPPVGSVSAQGTELMLATNCLGPYLLTTLLMPLLESTAAEGPLIGAVRVVWTSSQYIELSGPSDGLELTLLQAPSSDQARNYVATKIGNVYLAQQSPSTGVTHVVHNPGNLKTKLLRHTSWLMQVAVAPLLHPAHMGALTSLYAGFAPGLTSGMHVIPWSRVHPGFRSEFVAAMKSDKAGGGGKVDAFLGWCEEKNARLSLIWR